MNCIDVNNIARAAYKYLYSNDANKQNMSLTKRQQKAYEIYTSLVEMIESSKENMGDSIKDNKIIFNMLNLLLAYCYIININLNDYITITPNNEDNQ